VIKFELTGPERADEVRALWLELHHHHRRVSTLQPLVDDAASWQRRRALYLERFARAAGLLALAREGDDVVGYAFVCIEDGPDDTFPVGPLDAELYSLSVARRMRGNGVGTRLLDFVERELSLVASTI
jgi:ribosomal protein S18 acetylase RimI-like enzyme